MTAPQQGSRVEVPAEVVIGNYQQRLATVTHENIVLAAHVETLSATLQKYQQAYGALPTEGAAAAPEIVDAVPGDAGR